MQVPSLSHPLGMMVAMDALFDLSERQHGFVLRGDAALLGLSPAAVRHLVRRGEWIPEGRRLLRRAGAPWTKASPLMRAALDAGPGSVVSHSTAAAWWGLPGFDLLDIHVTRPRGMTCAPAAFAQHLHQVLDLSCDQVTVLDGIPIVRPERLAFELCGSVHPLRAARAIETGWSKGLFSGDSLRRVHAELAERGRKGTVVMREFLEARPPGWVPPASGLEGRVRDILVEAGLGQFRRQVDVGADHWVGRVDFLHDFLPLIVEVQSERYHEALLDKQHDAVRKANLEAAGFIVVEIWDSAVWYRRHEVVDAVRSGLRLARANLHLSASP